MLSETIRFNGEKLREFRKQRGWTQDRLAQLAGISVSHVSQLEKGTRKSPSVDMVYQLAEALSVSVYALLKLDVPVPSTLPYADASACSAEEAALALPLTAEAASRWTQWANWERTLRPEVAQFLFTDASQTYLTFAKALHDARSSSKRVVQLVNDFLTQLEPVDLQDSSAVGSGSQPE